MQFLFVFPNITKWKNADVSRTHRLCLVIYMFFRSSLGKIKRCEILSLWGVTFFRLFWSTLWAVMGEEIDYPGDLVKSVKTGRLPAAPWKVSWAFFSFWQWKSTTERLFRVGKKTLKLQAVSPINMLTESQ